MQKDFIRWNDVKQNIDSAHKPPLFSEREIWWCSVGVNIGYEIFGKGGRFTRPVLIIKKYSAYSFLAVPLTSKLKALSPLIYPINCKDTPSLLLFAQMRVFDARRLHKRIEKVGKEDFMNIKQALIKSSF